MEVIRLTFVTNIFRFQENSRTNQNYVDGPTAATVGMSPPAASLVPHYKKLNIKSDHDGGAGTDDAEDEDEDEQEPKDYTEMRVIEPSDVQVNIKVEHPQMTQSVLPTQQPPTTNIYMPTTTASTATMQPHAMSYASILQNMPHMGAGAILHAGSSSAGGVVMPAVPTALLQGHELPQKDASSATSEDGERWYICDYETCGLKFKYQSRLELHRSVHSKVRRFACELCAASFKQSCNLSTHRKKKHNIKGSKVDPRF